MERTRNRSVTLTIIAMMVASAAAASAYAEPDEALYRLRERCGRQATEWFEKDWGRSGIVNTDDGQMIANFENHYNTKLNTCFAMLSTTHIKTKPKTAKPTVFSTLSLFDVLNNKTVGEFFGGGEFPVTCVVSATICYSQIEWQTLVKPYMEQ
jgi:hypothetical protein